MKEIWKEFKEAPLYEISNLGKIRSKDAYRKYQNQYIKNGNRFVKGRILKTRISKNGYENITIRINNKHKTYSIHKLVALTFIPNPNNFLYINHKDGNKLNNNANNLEWCTQSHNVKESYKLGLQKPYTPPMMPNYVPWNKGKKLK